MQLTPEDWTEQALPGLRLWSALLGQLRMLTQRHSAAAAGLQLLLAGASTRASEQLLHALSASAQLSRCISASCLSICFERAKLVHLAL